MANSKKQGFNEDRVEQSNGNDFDDSSSILSAGGTSTAGSGRVSRERSEISLTERLTDILVDQGDGDLLLQRNDREERVLQWLQALDIQVIGACRADERLKPLLKLNASGSVAEDRLLAHLSQHFEPSEVGMLARCFCIPLVSIRVGKINKQGTLLCPTAIRGDLNLTLLPTTGLRLSFIGDDGNTERLFTLSGKTQCAAVEVDEIPADSSGRSFNLKISDGRVFYFWCSEKSKLLGIELVAKMKDILKSKPSIADLSGISKSRLDCFATHLRAYLSNGQEISAYSPASSSTTPETYDSTSTTKSLRTRHFGNQAVKTNSAYQGSLSPRSSSFKDSLSRSLSSLRNVSREKLRRCVDSHLSAVDKMMGALPLSHDGSRNQSGNEKLQEAKSCPVPSSVHESPGRLSLPPFQLHASHVMSSPPLSPYYCWCPQGASTLQSSTPLEIPTSSAESSLLPPLPPLLSASRPSNLLSPIPPLSLADFPSLDFPVLLPDPLVRFPISSSQQIPTFTPLMCDPIVHIPVIDVCSSGQGYLVSAGPTIATSIPPLHPKLVNPLIPNTADSLLEKGARETLRLLMSSTSQTNPQFMDFLPSVLTNSDQKRIATGSWSLYSGTRGVDAIANRIATMGLVSLSEYSIGDSVAEMSGSCDHTNNLPDNLPDESSAVDGPCSDDDCTFFSNAGEGTTN
ncbi:RNI superfamily protein [Salix suchowensis]|nr:RNI superfamily protein [Salix suchowensis]